MIDRAALLHVPMWDPKTEKALENVGLQPLSPEQESIITHIASILREEGFPVRHLRAIAKMIVFFQWSSEAEQEIFAFAAHLKAKYSDPVLALPEEKTGVV